MNEEVRAYALWEVEYRIAFDKKAPAPEPPNLERRRYYSLEAMTERVRQAMEFQEGIPA